MKIKCLLKCTSESNDYGRFFSGRKGRVQCIAEEFQLWEAAGRCEEESWSEGSRSALQGQVNTEFNSIYLPRSPPVLFSFWLISFSFCLCCSLLLIGSQRESCFRGDGNYECTSQTALKEAVQTHLKKHSWKNFNPFVLKSTLLISIKFWTSPNWAVFIAYHHPNEIFWLIAFPKHTSTSWRSQRFR